MRLAGKVAIVTGSGQGIGKAMAMRLAEEGAAVVVNGRDPGKIQNVVSEIRSLGGTAIGRAADVSKRSEVREMVDAAQKEYGHVDILVNNAIARSRARLLSRDDRRELGRRAGDGPQRHVQLHPGRRAPDDGKTLRQDHQHLVDSAMGSSAGPNECNINYAAAKAGIIQLTKSFAREFGPTASTSTASPPDRSRPPNPSPSAPRKPRRNTPPTAQSSPCSGAWASRKRSRT